MVSSAYLAFAVLVSVAAGLAQAAQQGSTPQTSEGGSIPQAPGSVYIVHMEKKEDDANARERNHLDTLSSVFDGSHEKAKESMLYSYTNAMNGFSAKLTPEQVSELSSESSCSRLLSTSVSESNVLVITGETFKSFI
jgi:hypothetical protein